MQRCGGKLVNHLAHLVVLQHALEELARKVVFSRANVNVREQQPRALARQKKKKRDAIGGKKNG